MEDKILEIKQSNGINWSYLLHIFWSKTGIEKALIKRRNKKRCTELREKFKDGDWVFGIGEHKGCSQVFTGTYGDMQPFSYLDDNDPGNFRFATKTEIMQACNSL